MKIAVLNYSGNVGKSLVTEQLLKPRCDKPEIFSVETKNKGVNNPDEVFTGEDFRRLMNLVVISDSAIIDIGSSNLEVYISEMLKYQGSEEDVDFFVVPTVPDVKQVNDTIMTIMELSEKLHVPPNKIRLLFNRVKKSSNIEVDFESIFSFHKDEGMFTLNRAAFIPEHDLFGILSITKELAYDFMNDHTDYRALILNEPDKTKKLELQNRLFNRRAAVSVSKSLDDAFAALFA